MLSGIVYFEEIVENIKDATGHTNLRNLYSRIKRFVFNVENDIGAGGVMVVKTKQLVKGDGFYDGKRIILPYDFVSEWSYGDLSSGKRYGNIIELYNDGPDKLDFKYVGFLLDENGNPFTTRNRLSAVVAYAVYRLYSSKVFMKDGGNANVLQMFKIQYEDEVLAARGNDAFPTEADFEMLGYIKGGGAFEAMTNCGMRTINTGVNNPGLVDVALADADPTCYGFMEGNSFASSLLQGILTFLQKLYMQGVSNGVTTTTGVLRLFANPIHALIGVSNGSANATSGTLLHSMVVVACNENFNYNGGIGTFSFRLDLGSEVGWAGLNYNSISIPDRFRVEYDGVEVANSKFVGSSSPTYTSQLLALGYTAEQLNLGTGSSGTLDFRKTKAGVTYATVHVDAPLGGTAWTISGICVSPANFVIGTSDVSGTLTSQTTGSLINTTNNNSATVTGVLTSGRAPLIVRSLGSTSIVGMLTVKAIQHCYTGIWNYPDPIHPLGGQVRYTDANGIEQLETGIWAGDRVTIMAVNIIWRTGVGVCNNCETYVYDPSPYYGEAVSYTIYYIDCDGVSRTETHYGGEGIITINNFAFLIKIQ